MAENLEKLQEQESKAAKISGVSLGLSMLMMMLWGWTPLKQMIPALPVLVLFVIFGLLAVAAAFYRVYKGIHVRALKARIADAE